MSRKRSQQDKTKLPEETNEERAAPPDREPDLGKLILTQLKKQGIALDSLECCGEGGEAVKVVCIAPNVGNLLTEMGQTRRDQVVMVRVDEETVRNLDAWVETGVVNSRSEAAALFMREGLQVRSAELLELRGALEEVEKARQKLKARVAEVLGSKPQDSR